MCEEQVPTGWVPLGAADLGSSTSVDYDRETGMITIRGWSRVRMADGATVELTRADVHPRAYPAGMPPEDVATDLI